MQTQSFFADESGAVTVDWVVLTAALVGLGLAVMTVVRGGVQNVSNDIDGTLRSEDIIQTAFVAAMAIPEAFGSYDIAAIYSQQESFLDQAGAADRQAAYRNHLTDAENFINAGNQSAAEFYINQLIANEQMASNRDDYDLPTVEGDGYSSAAQAMEAYDAQFSG
ncbi:MAG: hypothetical protein AAF366_02940 [Pseudomonadota bacterium]